MAQLKNQHGNIVSISVTSKKSPKSIKVAQKWKIKYLDTFTKIA